MRAAPNFGGRGATPSSRSAGAGLPAATARKLAVDLLNAMPSGPSLNGADGRMHSARLAPGTKCPGAPDR